MSQLWWDLPGPKGFLARVAADLRDGRNCVLCLPTVFPAGLREALESLLDVQGLSSWNMLHADDNALSPVETLFDLFAPDT